MRDFRELFTSEILHARRSIENAQTANKGGSRSAAESGLLVAMHASQRATWRRQRQYCERVFQGARFRIRTVDQSPCTCFPARTNSQLGVADDIQTERQELHWRTTAPTRGVIQPATDRYSRFRSVSARAAGDSQSGSKRSSATAGPEWPRCLWSARRQDS